jgi:hypothetical protein
MADPSFEHSKLKRATMTKTEHDQAVRFIANNRFPFPDQTDWPVGYVTLTNESKRNRSIESPKGPHWPDIVILNERGEACRLGEVEITVDDEAIGRWALCSAAADTMNETGVRNLFVYVPKGLGEAALTALESHAISFAGLREYVVERGEVTVMPLVTRGDRYDHR